MNIHPTHAVIDLSAFRHNLGIVRGAIAPSVRIMAVVKSNGYGHGVIPVAKEAVAFGVDFLAVARVDEGIELRRAGIDTPVLVFEVPASGQLEAALEERLHLEVGS